VATQPPVPVPGPAAGLADLLEQLTETLKRWRAEEESARARGFEYLRLAQAQEDAADEVGARATELEEILNQGD